LRPLPFIRMPSFPLSERERSAIVAYFNSVSNKESDELRRMLDPVMKYIAERNAAAKRNGEAAGAADESSPGDDWYLQPMFADTAQRLRQWALEHNQIVQIQLDPTRNSAEELTQSHRLILFKARFTAGLYDTPFPFVESPQATVDEDRFQLGEGLFHEMQCLKCHVLGDPSVAGSTPAPTAPNLALTHQRLQRRWVRHWVQEPPIIQAGTKMPPFLSGISVFNLNGLPWPASQGSDADFVQRIESRYGSTADEQAKLLLDFLYAAGQRGYTAIQPPASTQPAAAEAPQAMEDDSPAVSNSENGKGSE
jgi:hypothetical protein